MYDGCEVSTRPSLFESDLPVLEPGLPCFDLDLPYLESYLPIFDSVLLTFSVSPFIFRLRPSHFSGSVLPTFEVSSSHFSTQTFSFYGSVLPSFPSQVFSFFE